MVMRGKDLRWQIHRAGLGRPVVAGLKEVGQPDSWWAEKGHPMASVVTGA